jgi:hypothetical protein
MLVMIPLLIYYALRKFRGEQQNPKELLIFKRFFKIVVAILCLLVFTSNYGSNSSSHIVLTIQAKKSIQNDCVTIKQIDLNHCISKFLKINLKS